MGSSTVTGYDYRDVSKLFILHWGATTHCCANLGLDLGLPLCDNLLDCCVDLVNVSRCRIALRAEKD